MNDQFRGHRFDEAKSEKPKRIDFRKGAVYLSREVNLCSTGNG